MKIGGKTLKCPHLWINSLSVDDYIFANSLSTNSLSVDGTIFANKVYSDNLTDMLNCDYFNVTSGGNGALFLKDKTTQEQIRIDGDWSSDARLKKNINNTNVNALELINKIEHRKFDWKKDNKHEKLGYIAQELEEIDTNFVKKYEVKDENENIVDYDYAINGRFVISLLTKAMQEQQEIIDKQQAQIDFLMKKIDKKGEFKFESKIKKTKKVKDYGEKVIVKRKNKYEEEKEKMIRKSEKEKKEILEKLNIRKEDTNA